jgi:hypothetical protein
MEREKSKVAVYKKLDDTALQKNKTSEPQIHISPRREQALTPYATGRQCVSYRENRSLNSYSNEY